MKEAFIIYNPASGPEKGQQLHDLLKEKLLEEYTVVNSHKTSGPDDAVNIAKEMSEKGVDAIFAIGGDGTINQVSLGIIKAETEKKPVLGIIPGGTFNGVSRLLGYSTNPKTVIKNFTFDKTIMMDTAMFNDTLFNMIFSIGDIPESLHNVSSEEKSKFSVFAYAYNIARDAIKNNHYKLKITANDREIVGQFSHVAVMLSSTLNGLPINSNIKKNDGNLHVFLLKESSLSKKLAVLPDLINGTIKDNETIEYLSTKKLLIESLEGEVETDVDGDKSETLPANIEIKPKFLEVFSK